MKTLLILRHAKSAWDDPNLEDWDRPLNERGLREAPLMGKLMRKKDLLPDLVLCSNAKRARATLDLAAEASGYNGEIRLLPELYAAPPETYLKALSTLPDHYARVMVVGHNPGLEDLLHGLTGQVQALPTAALAQIEIPIDSWANATGWPKGELVGLWKPKDKDL
jgi:phosphohistidine phosphatase